MMHILLTDMKRLNRFLLLLAVAYSCSVYGQDNEGGIRFEKSSWKEILNMAVAQNKLVFVDFYTDWCGPCLNMAENVFTRPDVGFFYNEHFVCAKINAESEEGSKLAQQYMVHLYPTYCFIDPNTQEVAHRSSSTQTPEIFIKTGKNALVPTKRSSYLIKAYAEGDRSKQLLLDYIEYQISIHKQKLTEMAFDQLVAQGNTLRDRAVWDVFVAGIRGLSPYLQEVSDHYAEYCRLYSKAEVDAKLFAETQFGDVDKIATLCDFDGKQFNIDFIRIEQAIRQTNYKQAIGLIDKHLADTTTNKAEVMRRLKFMMNMERYNNGNATEEWKLKCLEYTRYLAYNWPDRKDGTIHQLYADMLEKAIKNKSNQNAIQTLITETPKYGEKNYTMRSPKMKQKPNRAPKR